MIKIKDFKTKKLSSFKNQSFASQNINSTFIHLQHSVTHQSIHTENSLSSPNDTSQVHIITFNTDQKIHTHRPYHRKSQYMGHTLKLSPQPHVPLMFGLLNINSDASLSVWQSISVPSNVNWALESIRILTPVQKKEFHVFKKT